MDKKDLVSLIDWEADEIREALVLAHEQKGRVRRGELAPSLSGKTLALLFEKSSMRTRVSFEVAMTQLGGHTLYLSQQDINLGKREPISDGARVLSRYVDAVAARTYSHAAVVELARYATVPVINALSDAFHPCQALADVMTLQERFGSAEGLTLAYIGDCNNVARSLGVICAKLGVNYTVACPADYQFDKAFRSQVESLASASGASFAVTESPRDAVRQARAVYTDTWVSMGQEEEAERRRRDFQGFCVDADLMAAAPDDAIVLHCLPACRGQEISDEVIEGPQCAAFDQAENRLHTQRAILHLLVGA